ncbi:MAG: arsenosugar biosynthesis-associated peroxidase-like protein [Saprospiraceae bacterium]
MNKQYFNPEDLKKFGSITELQEVMGKKFFDWYGTVFKGDTALTEREKCLIALAVSHTVQCPYCIDAYTSSCLEKGADEEQMMEAVHVAAAIKAGSTLVYGVQMKNQAEQMGM